MENFRTAIIIFFFLAYEAPWAHLLDCIADIVFDQKMLPELTEYLRLTRVIFARSPHWRTRWWKHQEGAQKEYEERMKEAAEKEGKIHVETDSTSQSHAARE